MLPPALQELSSSAGWIALNKFEFPLLKHLPSCQTAGFWKEAGHHLKPEFLSFTPSRSRAAGWEPGTVPRKSIPGVPSYLLQLLHRWAGGSCSAAKTPLAPSAWIDVPCSLVLLCKGAAFPAVSNLPACCYPLHTTKESKTGSWFWQGRKESLRTHRHLQWLPTTPLLSRGPRNTNMQCLLFIFHSFAVTFEQEKSSQLRDLQKSLSSCWVALSGVQYATSV